MRNDNLNIKWDLVDTFATASSASIYARIILCGGWEIEEEKNITLLNRKIIQKQRLRRKVKIVLDDIASDVVWDASREEIIMNFIVAPYKRIEITDTNIKWYEKFIVGNTLTLVNDGTPSFNWINDNMNLRSIEINLKSYEAKYSYT